MSELNGIFDQGFSGLLQDSNRKTMPDYIEKLAEQEINYEPPKLEVPNILFDKDSGLSRANELTSDGSRESRQDNRFTVERSEREAKDIKISSINKFVDNSVEKGNSFDDVRASLLSKLSREQTNRFLEAKTKLFLDKFSFLGFENIEEKKANIVEQSKNEFKITRSTVHDILNKFSKLEYISNSVVKQYKDLLRLKRPLDVVSKFMFSFETIKKSFYEEKEARVVFQRDIDEKTHTIRDVDNNSQKNSTIKKLDVFATMLDEYKQGIYSKLSRSEISKKLAKIHGYDSFLEFSGKFKNDITRIERFANRQTFSTDFASSALQGVEIQPKAKAISIDSKAMLNYAFDLMTFGNELELIKSSLKKKFGLEAASLFLNENESKLKKHYGQIGYLFIDSNIYSSCDEMASSYAKLRHVGSKLIYSLKANPKCANCTIHKEGTCSKVNLLVSNNPIVRSPRAAKRVFEKASSFVSRAYIDCFIPQLKESNLELVSSFTLGLQAAIDEEKKNIGKRASKDRSETTDAQEAFVSAQTYDIDISGKTSYSKIIDDVLGE